MAGEKRSWRYTEIAWSISKSMVQGHRLLGFCPGTLPLVCWAHMGKSLDFNFPSYKIGEVDISLHFFEIRGLKELAVAFCFVSLTGSSSVLQRSEAILLGKGEKCLCYRPCCKNLGAKLSSNCEAAEAQPLSSAAHGVQLGERRKLESAVCGHGLSQVLAAASSLKRLSIFLKDCLSKSGARCCLTQWVI